ncbi:hypothetical protein SYNPS1DRAFT_26146 [Syncephalis pseudoplumigaleata]|uniref:Transmembrane protein 242 n=1 Tax=Syncephalis pseudoplumigaleata TaxID=1712513 RepID=A0A4P9YS73_9FUNG|nr:hypothetical protein SYNPS1DRAFT_26146 [Syncephalis pseudoplumigaleata]|eukprot:RKP22212.1 hypothetical protein SYNPS1DRAFT_26146 [Syncephalis pseudoplumigaleata]
MAGSIAANGELEPYSFEARQAGRWLAIKALLAGSALCLTVSSVVAWGVGRALGVHNLKEFSELCRERVPQHAAPFRRLVYRGVDEAEANAIPLESMADIARQIQIEWERKQERDNAAE